MHSLSVIFSVIVELIETLWNVNFVNPPPTVENALELIETLWNVNQNRFKGGDCIEWN